MSSPSKRVEIGLKEREDEYIQYKQYHVLVGTFNVNNRQAPPNASLKQWFSQLTDKDETYVPDIIAVGFQEIDTSGGAYIYDDKRKENEWQDLVNRTIQTCYGSNTKANVEFFLLKQVRLIGILLFVYVRSDHKQKCTYISSSSVPTGFFGIAGNKGGVGVRFRFYESDICFINSHFASGDGQTARRNNDYQTIESTMAFTDGPTYSLKDYFWYTPGAAVGNVNPTPNTTTSHQWWKINDHDVIFWCGDMNYRISQANEQVRQAITERSTVPLHEKDQLRCEMKLQNVFMGYYEPPIEFMPTYKFDPNTEVYDTSEKLRTPSWTDRILYRSKRLKVKMNNETEVDTIKTIEYSSANEIRFSDHRPVSGLYAVTIKFACDEKRSNQIREELNRMSDRFENEAIPTIEVYPRPPEIKFSNVRYLDKPSYPLTIKNIGECVCSCTIQPSSLSPSFQYVICSPAPPFVIDVKGEQHVNISFNARLRKESISEILILHVENGADKFITLDLTFDNGPFGLALNEYPPTFYDNDTKKHIYSTEKPSTSQHIVEMINDPPVLYIALIETLKDRSDVNLLYIFSNETQDSLDVIPIRDQIYQHHYDFSKYSTAEIFMILVHLLQSLKDPLISFEIQDAIFSNSAQLTDSSRAVSILVEQLKGKERSLFFRLLVLLKTFWPTKEQIEKTDDEAGDAFNVCIDILALSIFHEHLDRTQRHACILACLNEEKKP